MGETLTIVPAMFIVIPVVRVAHQGRISIYLYPEEGQLHDRPHCPVSWPGGESVVALDRVEILAGRIPPAAALTLLIDHLPAVKAAWNTLNPRRHIA